jgi:hypothetical protein
MFKLIQKFICEYCGKEFSSEAECDQHEIKCSPMVTHTCIKCGKTETYSMKEDEYGFRSQEWSFIDLGHKGYGSKLDSCHVKFELCDDCLYEFVNSFIHKDEIYKTGW